MHVVAGRALQTYTHMWQQPLRTTYHDKAGDGKPFFISCLSFFSPHTGSFVLAWKRGIAILTAGEIKVSPDPRVRLVNGYTLQIRDAVPSDVGDYICQLGTLEPREITHHVEILSKISLPWFRESDARTAGRAENDDDVDSRRCL